ncbi:GTPase ObgE [Candidatus Peregrinibacteria bacterium]|nr:GTPase ObgE [Candidatus Peregrinibacteria bacterium]MBI3816435.1 GTPase ObgE [Candidatus Peregrinibacteria bacterium]
MFLDQAIIEVQGGHGGRGCVSWRREKYEPHGGPDGGNGGSGGDVILIADENTDTLSDFASTKKFEAQKGRFGSGKNRTGKEGEDLELRVPPGTILHEVVDDGTVAKEPFADLEHPGDRIVVGRGGRGGYGNAHFKSSTRQRPDFAELGEPGERRSLKLELKLVADVGIIGYPSVGKSTLISVISAARPKIADYPFTTLVPNLGVVHAYDRSYIICDLPGLIEGASDGKGLGLQFLRHIERCGVLLHVLDVGRALPHGSTSSEDLDPQKLIDDYHAIRKELAAYSPTLAAKKELVILNKIDLLGSDASNISSSLEEHNIPVFASISAAGRMGTQALAQDLLPVVLEERKRRTREEIVDEEEKALPVLRPHLAFPERMGSFQIRRMDDGSIRVTGRRIEQLAVMTDFSSRGGVKRLLDILERTGIRKSINRLRPDEEMPVYIGGVRVDEYL